MSHGSNILPESGPSSSEVSQEKASIYLPPPPLPLFEGPHGIRFDFNDGARIHLPERERGEWSITLKDVEAGVILYAGKLKKGLLQSSKRFFVDFEFSVEECSEDGEERPVFSHRFEPNDRTIVIQIPVGTLGDAIAWFSYVPRFAQKTQAKIICVLSEKFFQLFRDTYPDIVFVSPTEFEKSSYREEVYATYRMGLFFTDEKNVYQPTDFRLVGLHKTAAYILGVDSREQPPNLAIIDDTRPISEPYVCIATQASSQCKYWNNPDGWRSVIKHLRDKGYRVICIDRGAIHGQGLVWNTIPHGCEDETGDRPLVERARWLKHADFFIGTSSGLAWLAWAARTRVLLISGFTHPTNEFYTPYRIINWHTCNSCWNDPRLQFDHNDYLWCPRHANTERHFECSRLISSQKVVRVIDQLIEDNGLSAGLHNALAAPA